MSMPGFTADTGLKEARGREAPPGHATRVSTVGQGYVVPEFSACAGWTMACAFLLADDASVIGVVDDPLAIPACYYAVAYCSQAA